MGLMCNTYLLGANSDNPEVVHLRVVTLYVWSYRLRQSSDLVDQYLEQNVASCSRGLSRGTSSFVV